MSNSIIFYGAGNSARNNYDRLVWAGLRPVCFVDSNETLHHTCFESFCEFERGGVEILSLNEALKLYPDYVIYPTQNPCALPEVIDYLRSFVNDEKRIRTFEEHGFEWRRGCTNLDRYCVFFGDSLGTCCNSLGVRVTYSGSLFKDIQKLESDCCQIADDLRSGRPSKCDGCVELTEGWYYKKPQFCDLHISASKDMRCNFKCYHCNEESVLTNNNQFAYNIYDFIYEFGEVVNIKRVWFGSGEISIDKDAKQILSLCKNNDYVTVLFSNAFVFREDICDLLSSNSGSFINTSLDCGTRKTFKLIKGIDCFDKVVSNLKRYATFGSIYLKYIFFERMNDNFDDINGFVKLCCEIKPFIVGISIDCLKKDIHMTENMHEKVKSLLTLLRQAGQNFGINTNTMCFEDALRIRQLIQDTDI